MAEAVRDAKFRRREIATDGQADGLTSVELSGTPCQMNGFSTRQAAKQLGLGPSTLSRYIAEKKVPAPKAVTSGGITVHVWTEKDIERVRKLLPKIKNGRKTRFKREREEMEKKKELNP